MRYDSNNGLRIQQNYVAANDFKQIFYQKNNSVDSAALTIYKGFIGIGHTAPIGPLCVGNSSLGNSDGFILIGKNNGAGGSRHMRIGFNDSFQLTIGDAGSGTLGAWTQAFKMAYKESARFCKRATLALALFVLILT
jgi:hypothetical protein